MRRTLGSLALACLLGVPGCGEGKRAWDARCDTELARRVAAAQLPGPRDPDFIDWEALRNPILGFPDRSLKDQAVVYHDGAFLVFASARFRPGDPQSASKTPYFYRTRDFLAFEALADPDLNGPGYGPHSPDLTRIDGLWHMTFQAAGDGERAAILKLSTSPDGTDWSPPVDLAPELLDPAERNIDGALARHGGRFFLGWKRDQSLLVTRSAGPELDGRWSPPLHAAAPLAFGPSPLGHEWAENYQFLRLDGAWTMIATARRPGFPLSRHEYTGSHEPYVYTMDGSGRQLEDWTRWRCKRLLEVPTEDWNRAMHANSAFLADWRAHDGYFYLFYAGSNDHTSFDRRGHGKIGVARSRDLVRWRVPGDVESGAGGSS